MDNSDIEPTESDQRRLKDFYNAVDAYKLTLKTFNEKHEKKAKILEEIVNSSFANKMVCIDKGLEQTIKYILNYNNISSAFKSLENQIYNVICTCSTDTCSTDAGESVTVVFCFKWKIKKVYDKFVLCGKTDENIRAWIERDAAEFYKEINIFLEYASLFNQKKVGVGYGLFKEFAENAMDWTKPNGESRDAGKFKGVVIFLEAASRYAVPEEYVIAASNDFVKGNYKKFNEMALFAISVDKNVSVWKKMCNSVEIGVFRNRIITIEVIDSVFRITINPDLDNQWVVKFEHKGEYESEWECKKMEPDAWKRKITDRFNEDTVAKFEEKFSNAVTAFTNELLNDVDVMQAYI